ncbi:MAG TPA: HD domain-containing phosphohydrolase [Gemmatimonadota bacterium]|nr:HD domain-containing phosphohydrolase [Gemmatimonadota bacterium]
MSEPQEQFILVIDDEEPVLQLIRTLLASHGLSCRGVSDPRLALEILASEPVDLVISDAHMAGPGSREILDRAARIGTGIPVVLTTRQQSIAAATRSIATGAYDVLKKPFEFSRLPGIVHRALEKQRLARENEALRDQLALYQIITAVNASIDEQEILQTVLASVERAFEADRVRLFSRRAGRRRFTHWRGGTQYADPLAAIEERLAQRIMEDPTPLVIPEEGAGPDLLAGQASTALAIPLRGRETIVGAITVVRRQGPWTFTRRDLATLEILAGNVGAVMDSASRTRREIESRAGLMDSDPTMIGSLVAALDAREHEDAGHSVRVAEYALRLAHEMGLPATERTALKFGAMLHDIGKIGVSDDILVKAGPLAEDERSELERHPVVGYEILRGIRFIRGAAEIVLCHQERYDGSGYPNGLSGADIPLGARIVAVADTLEAMTHERPYRQALAYADVLEDFTHRSARRFDPYVVDAFLRVPESDWELIRERIAEGEHRWNLFTTRAGIRGAALDESHPLRSLKLETG